MRRRSVPILIISLTVLALTVGAPAQADQTHTVAVAFEGVITLGGNVCYPAPAGTCPGGTVAITSFTQEACASAHVQDPGTEGEGEGGGATAETPVGSDGTCSISGVSGSVGAHVADVAGAVGSPRCGLSQGTFNATVTVSGGTAKLPAGNSHAVTITGFYINTGILVIGQAPTVGVPTAGAAGFGAAVPNAPSASCVGAGTNSFRVAGVIGGIEVDG